MSYLLCDQSDQRRLVTMVNWKSARDLNYGVSVSVCVIENECVYVWANFILQSLWVEIQ